MVYDYNRFEILAKPHPITPAELDAWQQKRIVLPAEASDSDLPEELNRASMTALNQAQLTAPYRSFRAQVQTTIDGWERWQPRPSQDALSFFNAKAAIIIGLVRAMN